MNSYDKLLVMFIIAALAVLAFAYAYLAVLLLRSSFF